MFFNSHSQPVKTFQPKAVRSARFLTALVLMAETAVDEYYGLVLG